MLERLVPAALVAALLTMGASACRPAPTSPSDDGTTGTGTAATEPPAATTFAEPDACQSSEDCETEGSCVAPYDPGSDPPMGQGGCVQACIEIDDLSRWCFDDEACCGDARCHEVDGLCEPGPGSTESSTSDGTGTSTGSGSDTGTSTSDGTGTGTSTGTSTSDGTGTSTSDGAGTSTGTGMSTR